MSFGSFYSLLSLVDSSVHILETATNSRWCNNNVFMKTDVRAIIIHAQHDLNAFAYISLNSDYRGKMLEKPNIIVIKRNYFLDLYWYCIIIKNCFGLIKINQSIYLFKEHNKINNCHLPLWICKSEETTYTLVFY